MTAPKFDVWEKSLQHLSKEKKWRQIWNREKSAQLIASERNGAKFEIEKNRCNLLRTKEMAPNLKSRKIGATYCEQKKWRQIWNPKAIALLRWSVGANKWSGNFKNLFTNYFPTRRNAGRGFFANPPTTGKTFFSQPTWKLKFAPFFQTLFRRGFFSLSRKAIRYWVQLRRKVHLSFFSWQARIAVFFCWSGCQRVSKTVLNFF
jgi:hypothetical protein